MQSQGAHKPGAPCPLEIQGDKAFLDSKVGDTYPVCPLVSPPQSIILKANSEYDVAKTPCMPQLVLNGLSMPVGLLTTRNLLHVGLL